MQWTAKHGHKRPERVLVSFSLMACLGAHGRMRDRLFALPVVRLRGATLACFSPANNGANGDRRGARAPDTIDTR